MKIRDKIQMCILQVRYSTVEYNFVIECDLVQGALVKFRFSSIVDFNVENDHSTDADVGWYVNNSA